MCYCCRGASAHHQEYLKLVRWPLVHVLPLQVSHHISLLGPELVPALIRSCDVLPATITHVPVAAVLVLNTPDDGRLRPKHVVTAEIKPAQCCIKLVFHLTYTMMHRNTKLKHPPGVEVKNEWSCTPNAPLHAVYNDKFTFTFTLHLREKTFNSTWLLEGQYHCSVSPHQQYATCFSLKNSTLLCTTAFCAWIRINENAEQ